jgi:hypothetical protein
MWGFVAHNPSFESTSMNRKKEKLQRFEAGLKAVMGDDNKLRPFVCEGSPLECQTFIVGFNAATEFPNPFWPFWKSDYGFDKAKWLERYKKERQSKPLAPGKTRRTAISPTRQRIDRITEAAAPIKCLETNLYAAPSRAAQHLASEGRHTACFDFLLTTIRPTAILVHGEEAADHLRGLLKAESLLADRFVALPTSWGSVHVRAVGHLSRGWSYASAEELGRSLRLAVEGAELDPTASVTRRKTRLTRDLTLAFRL